MAARITCQNRVKKSATYQFWSLARGFWLFLRAWTPPQGLFFIRLNMTRALTAFIVPSPRRPELRYAPAGRKLCRSLLLLVLQHAIDRRSRQACEFSDLKDRHPITGQFEDGVALDHRRLVQALG